MARFGFMRVSLVDIYNGFCAPCRYSQKTWE
jgi:hypothetical protein